MYSQTEISLVSKDFRKVIVVTGCRGAGATSTAANLAIESSAQGLSTILVDMDIQYRGVICISRNSEMKWNIILICPIRWSGVL